MTKRRLRQDELDLWRQVARTAKPLTPDQPGPTSTLMPPKKGDSVRKATPEPAPIPAFRLGQKSKGPAPTHDVLPGLTDRMKALPVTMDRKAYGKLKRGKLRPEARIDLHGMTVDRAHGVLSGFILRAHGQGKRLVLVITGKGRRSDDDGPIPVRQGVLRHNVPHWLSIPPLNQAVMQVSEAHGRHGGGGAYYVYLRRT
ncbi:Smr/MutS family protein [Roseovarius aestuarii]|nr:Smr/MutS family protein [Roseovarius aestuarii]